MPKWRRWAVRAIAAFAVVYGLGLVGVPTLVPYITALLLVAIDAWRTAARTG
jgi:hypothetical protein